MARVDLSTLTLEYDWRILYEPEEDEDGEEEDEPYLDEEMERWNSVLSVSFSLPVSRCHPKVLIRRKQIIECKIVDRDRKVLGALRVWAFATGEFEFTEDFLSFMDEWSRTGVWGSEVTDHAEIAYLEHMHIEPEYRGQGIGAWALRELYKASDGIRVADSDFLFVQPGALEEEFPSHDPFAPDPHREAKLAMSDRITRFYQRNGFRRVGTTSYLCLAFDPNHPSRRIPIDEDAKFVEDVTMSQGELVGMLARDQMPWPPQMTPLDLSTLSLRCHSRQPNDYENDSENGTEEEGYLTEESERQNRVQTVLWYEIVDASGEEVGRINAWIFRTKEFQDEGGWLMFMDEESQETHEFSCLFTDRALLKSQFSREGTGVWGAEVTERPLIAYIEGIRVEPEYRGQGIGSWALEKLLDVKDPYFGTVDFIFAWPTPHPKDAPKRDDPNREQIWDSQIARAVKTFQRAGYRRLGTTAFFCLARDPNHTSRRIAVPQDAQNSTDVGLSEEEFVKMLGLGELPW
ncbi:hypothetical protein JCM10296v2_000439 [Rhodotorula toruloides]